MIDITTYIVVACGLWLAQHVSMLRWLEVTNNGERNLLLELICCLLWPVTLIALLVITAFGLIRPKFKGPFEVQWTCSFKTQKKAVEELEPQPLPVDDGK